MSYRTNIIISSSILALFLIIITIGYFYVTETRENVRKINGTLVQFINQSDIRAEQNNIRWNLTFTKVDDILNITLGEFEEILNISRHPN